MYVVIYIPPNIDALAHTLRVLGLGFAHIEAHLNVFILGPILQDACGQVIAGTLQTILQFFGIGQAKKFIQI